MKELDGHQLASFLSFEPAELALLVKDTCGWLRSEPLPLKISHTYSQDVSDRAVNMSRDLLAIAGIPELVRRQRSRIAHSLLETLGAFMKRESMSRRAYACRFLLELCGVCSKVARAASMEGRKIFKQLEKDIQAGCPSVKVFEKTPMLLRVLWERAQRTGIDWIHLVESGELVRYQRADERYSDIADFREDKETTGDLLASIQSVAAEYMHSNSPDWSLIYAFLSEFIHPNLGAFLEIEAEYPLGEINHPHLEIGVLLDPSFMNVDSMPIPRYVAMVRSADLQLWTVLRDVILLSVYVCTKLKQEENALRAICKILIISTLNYLNEQEIVRVLDLLPTGRCICLQAVRPKECCFTEFFV